MLAQHVRRVNGVTAVSALNRPCATTGPVVQHVDADLRYLDDEQMAHFVEHGYVLLPMDELPDEFHIELYQKCEKRWVETGGRNGKDIFKEIPELQQVLTSKTLQGGLASVLGNDYAMHPARHMHVSGENDGGFHKDGGHCSIRHHRPRWAMAMYYAGGCSVNMVRSSPCSLGLQ